MNSHVSRTESDVRRCYTVLDSDVLDSDADFIVHVDSCSSWHMLLLSSLEVYITKMKLQLLAGTVLGF